MVTPVSADGSSAPKSGTNKDRTTRLKWRFSFQRRADTQFVIVYFFHIRLGM